jgi:hypothetical protein
VTGSGDAMRIESHRTGSGGVAAALFVLSLLASIAALVLWMSAELGAPPGPRDVRTQSPDSEDSPQASSAPSQ